jgi:hypothetical protein
MSVLLTSPLGSKWLRLAVAIGPEAGSVKGSTAWRKRDHGRLSSDGLSCPERGMPQPSRVPSGRVASAHGGVGVRHPWRQMSVVTEHRQTLRRGPFSLEIGVGSIGIPG